MMFLRKCFAWSISVVSLLFTIVPESTFKLFSIFPKYSSELNVILNRVFSFVALFVLTIIINSVWLLFRRKVHIKGKNYRITVKYGDLLEAKKCKKIIPFDECFTTKIGTAPWEIKKTSICGQYLMKNPISDMQVIIDKAQLKPMQSKSKYNRSTRYESGKLLLHNNDLLMAFAKLNEDGKATMTHDEFLDSLSMLWKEIEKYNGQEDVCIPILGSGITKIGDNSLTQQELLEIIISSYKLSSHKIKPPHTLYIICKKCDDFSLNKIQGK